VKFKPTMSLVDLSRTAADLVSNSLILEPTTPTPILADHIVEEADKSFVAEFGRSLCVEFFNRKIRAERRRASGMWREKLPPDFNRLPLRIIGERGKRVRLDQSTYADARSFCKHLGTKRRDRSKNDVQFAQACSFRDYMAKASKTARGVKAGAALGFDFGEGVKI
jgi:hypothetical protein